MTSTAIMSVVFGLLIVCIRGLPWLLTPVGAMGIFRKLTDGPREVRIWGSLGIVLGLSMVLSAQGPDTAAEKLIFYLGWYFLVVCPLFFLAFPAVVQVIARVFDELLSDSNTVLRSVGLIGVGVGGFFVYLGISVL